MYHTLADASELLGMSKDKLRYRIAAGYLPKRWFGKTYVLTDADLEIAKGLVSIEDKTPIYKNAEPIEVGYTVERAAAMAFVVADQVVSLAETGYIPAQRLGRSWLILPDAIERIKVAPPVSERREKLTYRTNKGNPKVIPPLDERYRTVVRRRLAGEKFSVIATELGVSRERPSKMFATVLQRVVLLGQRGIVELDKIASALQIDNDMAESLIKLVTHANE